MLARQLMDEGRSKATAGLVGSQHLKNLLIHSSDPGEAQELSGLKVHKKEDLFR